MNLKKIQAFLLVIEKGSFSDAADRLGLSQPAVSQQVKSLEDDLGVPLINRASPNIQPTKAGYYVYKIGRQLIEQWQELEAGIQAFHGTVTGTLRIGASTIPGTYLLPRWIGKFYRSHPNIDVIIDIGDSKDIHTKLLNRQIDLGIVGSEPDSKEIVSKIVAVDSLVLISPLAHPIITADHEKDPCDLLQYDFVLREEGSGTRKAMEEGLTRCGIEIGDLRSVAQFGSTEALIAAVEEGLGISYVSMLAAAPAVKAGRIHLVSVIEPFNQKFYLTYLKGNQNHPLIKEFDTMIETQSPQI